MNNTKVLQNQGIERYSLTAIVNRNPRNSYLVFFLTLVVSSILVRVLTSTTRFSLSHDAAGFLTFISKIGMIILTGWYSWRVGFGGSLAAALSFSTLLPFMTWVCFIVLLTSKVKTTAQEKEKTDTPSQERGADEVVELTRNKISAENSKVIVVFIAILACLVLLLFGWFVWPTQYRYDQTTLNGNTFPVRIDRITEKVEILVPISGWTKPGCGELAKHPKGSLDLASPNYNPSYPVDCGKKEK